MPVFGEKPRPCSVFRPGKRASAWTGCTCVLLIGAMMPSTVRAQVTLADYDCALNLQEKYKGLVLHLADEAQWIGGTDRFAYRVTVKGGQQFVVVDAETQTRQATFDHARLAETLTKALGEPMKPDALLLKRFKLFDGGATLEFVHEGNYWRCDLKAYTCAEQPHRDVADDDGGYDSTPAPDNYETHGVMSPDGKWVAFVENYNVTLRPAHVKEDDARRQTRILSEDGSEGNYYAVSTLVWSPDSRHLAVYRIRPGYRREIHYIESSPSDQLQPKYSSMVYPKAGDVLSLYQPVLFDVNEGREVAIDNTLFPNPYEMLPIAWWKDSRGFTFEYNQRGHQIYRVIEVNANDGKARTLIEEKSTTFVNYEPLTRNQYDHGKYYRQDIDDGREILWASERDGWEHLYLFDGHTGALIRKITQGDWAVRAVDHVDEVNSEIYFEASGMDPNEDPYYVHGYKIRFDGTGLTPLTPAKADHTLMYSPDGKYFVDTYSRIDLPPVMELRRASDADLMMTVETADDSALKAAGWKPAEPFHTAGRDGKMQI